MSDVIKGGEFLIRDTQDHKIFIPEEWTQEHKMVADSCHEFIEQEVMPILDRIDNMEEGLMPALLDKAGQLGILSISLPEKFGGLGKDFNTGLLVTEATGAGHSFAVAMAAHTGIGTLPILYFGTPAQKEKYLPKLATGEWKGCYCLTEPGAGSDANAGKTKAVLSADKKSYVLNGQKMWITNGGFADVFIVFAKIGDDKDLSAFIVEKSFGGISLNPEEKKMGIKGSSTRQVFFNDCKVPAENLLGKREQGFKIALNILNLGRIKLSAAALGASKKVCERSIKYANERVQFGTSIGTYGAIQHKLAEQAIRTWVNESATYRTGAYIDQLIDQLVAGGTDPVEAKLKSMEEYAVECAMLKVHGSETLDYVVDEGVQIYGGMGFSAEGPMDRSYRDSRINRIFEGTNEINRLLTVEMMLRKALKGELDLMKPAKAVAGELMSMPTPLEEPSGAMGYELTRLAQMKKAVLMVAGSAVQEFGKELEAQQEILMNLADMLIELYAAESAVLRVRKMSASMNDAEMEPYADMARCYLYTAIEHSHQAAKEAISAMATGDTQKMMLLGAKRFYKHNVLNTIELRRKIAARLLKANNYCF